MTSFVQVDYPTEHHGVLRAQRAVRNIQALAQRLDGARSSAAMLLAAIVAALVVVANQLIDTWTEGHLLAAWVVLWTVAFAAIAAFAAPVRSAVLSARAALRRRAEARRQAALDEQLWDVALTDARVMADLSRAMSAQATRDVRDYY